MRGRDVRGPAVQQQVAERRPDHPDAVLGEDPEVGRFEPIGVDRDQRWRQRPAAVGEVERGEMLAGGRAEALGKVKDQPVRLAQPREERLGVAGVDVGDARVGVDEVGFLGRLDVPDVAAVIRLDPVVAVEGDALRGSDATDEALAFDVADDRLGQADGLAEDGHRPADPLAVVGHDLPLPAVPVRPRGRPQRQGVVAQVVVQLDQARVDRASGRDPRGIGEIVGRVLGGGQDASDPIVGDVHRAVLEHGPGLIDGDDTTGQDVAHGSTRS